MTLGRAISDNNNKMIIPTSETFWEASCNNANYFKTYFKMSNNVILKKTWDQNCNFSWDWNYDHEVEIVFVHEIKI
jgi:hypothetical protein